MNDKIKRSEQSLKEGEILNFWNENNIFKKSIEQNKNGKEFVFFDGPPFATGLPHYGHIIPGTIKDVFPRYKTMKGFKVERNWGWDCHGMPIENIVEKKLDLKSKEDIENFGIEKFAKEARNSIFTFKKEWEEIIPRTGRWVDMQNHYKTMDNSFMESEWWAFAEIYKKGLVREDFKPMHICPRCETTLSNRDVSEGYKDIKDLTLIAKFALLDEEKTFILAWTTTPWTLPGNAALAAGAEIDYVKVKSEFEGEINYFIVAKNLVEKIFNNEVEILEEFKGEKLVGKEYEPLFDYYSQDNNLKNRENGWKVYPADFVSTEEGTGIVHIAPAFGEDDLELGRKYNLPFIQHISIDGKFKTEVQDFAGLRVRKKEFHEEADIEIIKNLAHQGKLFSKEKYEHSYPHCWRCDTPLLNYATSSWFIDVPQVKDELVRENDKVNWVPDFLGHKRFKNWLENAKMWAISRQRYWGTPIPIWKNKESGEVRVIASLAELKEKTRRNKYLFLRHAQSQSNIEGIISSSIGQYGDRITEQGKKDLTLIKDNLKDVDVIFASPFIRTKETAELVANGQEIIFDERIAEIKTGSENGKKWSSANWDAFEENWEDVKKRVMEFIYDIDNKYQNKKILIVAHGIIGSILMEVADTDENVQNAKIYDFDFAQIPHNEKYELDFHRPYIDQISWEENGKRFEFIKEVFDTWFDSGSMPFASQHYPFNNLEKFNPKKNIGFPADFIAEAQDQTRGWFYVLLIINYILFKKSPYKNVVTTGMLMAEDGRKMSKSLGNYPPVEEILNKYGADSLRLFLLSSSIVRGDSPAFSEKGVDEIYKKVILRSKNILSFYNLYQSATDIQAGKKDKHLLDRWIVEKVNHLSTEVSNGLENYTLDEAVRPLIPFIDDLSTWYIRRSRERFKGEFGEADKANAVATTNFVLRRLAKLLAPFAPFLAEEIWQVVKNEKDQESVHLEKWPEIKKSFLGKILNGKNDLLNLMSEGREVVSLGLEMRSASGLKVRQPLESIFVINASADLKKNKELAEIIKDELNIKNIYFVNKIEEVKEINNKELTEEFKRDENELRVVLNKEISPELKKEGDFREFLRQVQIMRKNNKLAVKDIVELKVDLLSEENSDFIDDYLTELKKTAGVKGVNYGKIEEEEEIKINDKKIKIVLIVN